MVHLNLSIVAHVHKICPSRRYSDPSNASAAYEETFQILLRFHGFVDSLWSYSPLLQFLREANLGGRYSSLEVRVCYQCDRVMSFSTYGHNKWAEMQIAFFCTDD